MTRSLMSFLRLFIRIQFQLSDQFEQYKRGKKMMSTVKVEESYGKIFNTMYTVTILVLFHFQRAASGGSRC